MNSVIDSNSCLTDKKGSKLIFKIIGLFNKIDQVVASTSLALIVILTIYGVVMRYVINSPSAWVEEVCLALFMWFTFMGASVLMSHQEHVNVDYLIKKLPTKLYLFVNDILVPILISISLMFMLFYGLKLLQMSENRFTSTLQIPYVYIYAAIPLGAFFMLYHQFRIFIVNKLICKKAGEL
jgi:TRAP-type C4-dicarboxylate transport system permease small subunit